LTFKVLKEHCSEWGHQLNYILQFCERGAMTNHTKIKLSGSLLFITIVFIIFSLSFINSNHVSAAGEFSVEAKINLKKLNHPDKLKVVASANGDTETKYLTGNDLDSNTATFHLNSTRRMTLLLSVVGMSIWFAHMPLML